MAIYEHTFEVGFRDVGKSNELSNRAIIGFFEDIGGMHSNQAGFGLNNIEETKLTWVLLNWKIKVYKRAIYGEKVLVKTWAKNAARFYTYRDFELYNEQGQIIAIATSKWVLLNASTMRLTKITPEIIQKYDPEEKDVFPDSPMEEKLKEPEIKKSSYEYTIRRNEIDINNHMHNLYYLDLAYEALPKSIYENNNFSSVEIMYKKEIKLGEKVVCYYSCEEDQHFITIKNDDSSTLHAIIRLA